MRSLVVVFIIASGLGACGRTKSPPDTACSHDCPPPASADGNAADGEDSRDGNSADGNARLDGDASDGGTRDGDVADGDASPPDVLLDQSGPCLSVKDIGCFTGVLCGSARVESICVQGRWQCPAGSQATEFCPPDAGPGN